MTATVPDLETPLDRYRRAQATLTAVEELARAHDGGGLRGTGGRYRRPLPAMDPGPGRQLAFEVDLDACTGCKACVTACHRLNGLDSGETFRRVGVLHGEGAAGPVLQTVTAACHHCAEPACLHGCPANAYEKDPVTGIVVHLDDQCIGCSYCTLTCPYEVPTFNAARGIVRKCDLCTDRLAAGEAPACVQGCPTDAIAITVVDTTTAPADDERLVPGAPPSALTRPTTRYRSRRGLPPGLRAADELVVRPAHGHPPLAVMLVLTQLSVGAFAASRMLPGMPAELAPANAAMALAAGLLALGASVLHLGRPLVAYRAVLGLRRSWLSREIVAFGVFAALAAAHAAAVWTGHPLAGALGLAVVASGVAGVASSVLIYAVTGRRWWRAPVTAAKFALTATIGGVAAVGATSAVVALAVPSVDPVLVLRDVGRPAALVLAAAVVVKLAVDAAILSARAGRDPELARTALLLRRELRSWSLWRVAAALVGGVLTPAVLAAVAGSAEPPTVFAAVAWCWSLAAVTASELVERLLFFRASSPPRMPGGLP